MVIVLLVVVSVMSTFVAVTQNTIYEDSVILIEKPLGPMALSDHYPEPSGTIDDGTGVVAIVDLPDVAQKSEQIDWVKDGGKTIVDLGASCGEIKAFDPTRLYRDNLQTNTQIIAIRCIQIENAKIEHVVFL